MTEKSRQAEVELQTREEELRFLQIELREAERSLRLAQKQAPAADTAEDDLIRLQLELKAVKERVEEVIFCNVTLIPLTTLA